MINHFTILNFIPCLLFILFKNVKAQEDHMCNTWLQNTATSEEKNLWIMTPKDCIEIYELCNGFCFLNTFLVNPQDIDSKECTNGINCGTSSAYDDCIKILIKNGLTDDADIVKTC